MAYRAPLEEGEQQIKAAARALKDYLPVGWGYLMVFYQYGGPGQMTYLSTGQREDCIKLLKEFLAALESGDAPMEDKPI